MKYSQMVAWENNSAKLDGFQRRYGRQLPESLMQEFKDLKVPVKLIQGLPYKEFCDKFPAETVPEFPKLKIADEVLYVYLPELENSFEGEKELKKKRANFYRLQPLFRGVTGVEASEEFRDFVLNVLPAEIPTSSYLDGSAIRVKNILQEDEEARYYGNDTDSIFAVIHRKKTHFDDEKDQKVITFFVKELDPISSFTKTLVTKLNGVLGEETAKTISGNLPHDHRYEVKPFVNYDFKDHAEKMARFLHVSSTGEKVMDYYQGECGVYRRSDGSFALDLDDDLPSAIVVKWSNRGSIEYRLNIYLPHKKK